MSGIFEGLKILDFSWVIVGPRTVRYLADQGATVVKVENINYPCAIRQSPPFKDGKSGINRSAYFTAYNINKMSIGIDLANPEGTKIIMKLAKWADVIIESFAPGIMESFGLGYEDIKRIKPDVIFLRTNMLGATGPRASMRGFGFQLVGYTGFTYITGWPDRTPVQPFGPYTDSIAPRFTTSALILALIHKRRTGKGVYIDVSQHETGIQFLAPILLDRQITGRNRERRGNLHSVYCPHGVYPCKGEDRWIAIAVTSDEEWAALIEIVDTLEIRQNEFASKHDRKQNEDKIDAIISQWTRQYTAEEITERLQEKGIPAGIVENSQDLAQDPQLAYRKAIWYLDNEEVGRHAAFGQGFILSKAPPPDPKPSPRLGEHTFSICKEILNMRDEEIAKLLRDGVLQIMV